VCFSQLGLPCIHQSLTLSEVFWIPAPPSYIPAYASSPHPLEAKLARRVFTEWQGLKNFSPTEKKNSKSFSGPRPRRAYPGLRSRLVPPSSPSTSSEAMGRPAPSSCSRSYGNAPAPPVGLLVESCGPTSHDPSAPPALSTLTIPRKVPPAPTFRLCTAIARA
jgi:hypothetical protein